MKTVKVLESTTWNGGRIWRQPSWAKKILNKGVTVKYNSYPGGNTIASFKMHENWNEVCKVLGTTTATSCNDCCTELYFPAKVSPTKIKKAMKLLS